MWRQGEHVAAIGDTGSGKTFLFSRLLEPNRFRDFIIILKTKRKDDSFDNFKGYKEIRAVREIKVTHDFYVLAPSRESLRSETIKLLNMADAAGGWTVVIDELFFLQEKLKLADYIDDLLTQGRSSGLTIVCGMQRPVRITRFAISQARHVFAFEQEGRDATELSYATSRGMRDAVEGLERYEFAYFDRRNRRHILVGKAQKIDKVLERFED
jgi:DNA helicase HerA-like ATPase